jgi:regulator of protease activity HflC (stomatin/prohibitin superfamily)
MAPRHEMLHEPPSPRKYRWWRFIEHNLPVIVIYLMVATLVGFVIAPNVIITVPSGHVGLLWKRFRGGTVIDPRQLKEEGMRVLLPWDRLFIYDLRLQTTTDTYNAISKDGVNLAATINIRFRLKHDSIPQLHQVIGPDYVARLVRPEIGNRAREIIAEYTAEEVYSVKRQEIQQRIRTHTTTMLGQSMVQRTKEQSEYGEQYRVSLDDMLNLYDTLLLGLELPPTVVAAINRKVEQYYLVQEYAFRVDRERKESERKLIEAQGIRAFQQTVSQGISDSYVRWRGIEATLQLAQSNNSKIVIIGSGKDGLPIILGNVDTPIPAAKPDEAPPGPGPDNGATPFPKERTTGQPPPPLEWMPPINLSQPSERPPPLVPTPIAPPGPRWPPATPPDPSATPRVDDKRSQAPAEPPTSSVWSDIGSYISRAVRSVEPNVAPPAPSGAPPPPPHPGSAPTR